MDLQTFFKENPRLTLGFSGGVDSVYLLYAGLKHGADIEACFVKTAFQPAFELADARKAARLLGARLSIITLETSPEVAANTPERCYYCKRRIFGVLAERAQAQNRLLTDGSNASDEAGERPGMRALTELKVRSPLRECGITKAEVRRLSKEAGLFTWDKPAYACLATRVPTGREITAELLQRVEQAEAALFGLGFSDFRVRVLAEAARLQLTGAQQAEAFARKDEIIAAIRPWFSEIVLDLDVRAKED